MPKTATKPLAIRDRIIELRRVPARDLIANPRNWRTHPKAQQDAMRGVLTEIGYAGASLARLGPDGELLLIDGHLRQDIAPDAVVPVLVTDLDEAEADYVLATYDPLSAMAGQDDARLAELMASVQTDNEAVAAMLAGLRVLEPAGGLTDPDDVPPVPEPTTKAGDLWKLGEHRLLCGDSLDPEAVSRLLGACAPTLLVTDPPYGVQLDPTWRDGVYNKLGPGASPYMTEAHENRTLSGDTVVDWSPAFALVPSLEVAYVWHAGVHAPEVGFGLQAIGFEIRSQIIWAKSHFAMGRGAYNWQHEPCWFAVRKGKTSSWLGNHSDSTLWELASPKMIMGGSAEQKYDHPAQKPVECMERPVRNHSGEVYEPFSGSGTTIIACERQQRRCFAMEIDPKYADVAVRRWEAFTGKTAVLA